MYLRRVIHLVGLLACGLLLSCSGQDCGVSADLHDEVNKLQLPEKPVSETNLLNQIKEVALRVRAISGRALVGLVKCRDSRVQYADRTLAELQVFRR